MNNNKKIKMIKNFNSIGNREQKKLKKQRKKKLTMLEEETYL